MAYFDNSPQPPSHEGTMSLGWAGNTSGLSQRSSRCLGRRRSGSGHLCLVCCSRDPVLDKRKTIYIYIYMSHTYMYRRVVRDEEDHMLQAEVRLDRWMSGQS
ncbi:hypothetical protein ILYODFUR_037803 [Ilyodon furcidens]|uniref:Uncharacterized protein n=1 Tax=Ilyodon furcidens TaxID=33524 RepID=A0ABV0VKH2_9TELE